MKVMTKQQNTVRLLLFELWSAKFLLLCCCSRTVQYKELQIGLWMKQHYSDTVTGNHVLCCRKLVSGVSQCHYDIIVIVGSLQGQNAECVKYACVLRFTPTAQSAGKTSTWLNCCLMRFERHKHPSESHKCSGRILPQNQKGNNTFCIKKIKPRFKSIKIYKLWLYFHDNKAHFLHYCDVHWRFSFEFVYNSHYFSLSQWFCDFIAVIKRIRFIFY